jgi:hypothetical protein
MGATEVTQDYDPGYVVYRNAVQKFVPRTAASSVQWPRELPREAHFDPDFKYLTYGDGGQRATRIKDVLSNSDNNFIVFYAGFVPFTPQTWSTQSSAFTLSIAYAMPLGSLVRSGIETHTRVPMAARMTQVVVFARRGESGRLLEHIPIGEYRRRAYRVTNALLETWGGLDVLDGFIQRSVFLPRFLDPDRFLNWFYEQKPTMIARNNP